MNKKLKQIAASLLSVLMIVCFMPSMAFAAEPAKADTSCHIGDVYYTSLKTAVSAAKEGDTIVIDTADAGDATIDKVVKIDVAKSGYDIEKGVKYDDKVICAETSDTVTSYALHEVPAEDGGVIFNWDINGIKATATCTIKDANGHTTKPATAKVESEPKDLSASCVEDVDVTYTASYTYEKTGKTYTDIKKTTIEKTGHTYAVKDSKADMDKWWDGKSYDSKGIPVIKDVKVSCINGDDADKDATVTFLEAINDKDNPPTCIKEGKASYKFSVQYDGETIKNVNAADPKEQAKDYVITIDGAAAKATGVHVANDTVEPIIQYKAYATTVKNNETVFANEKGEAVASKAEAYVEWKAAKDIAQSAYGQGYDDVLTYRIGWTCENCKEMFYDDPVEVNPASTETKFYLKNGTLQQKDGKAITKADNCTEYSQETGTFADITIVYAKKDNGSQLSKTFKPGSVTKPINKEYEPQHNSTSVTVKVTDPTHTTPGKKEFKCQDCGQDVVVSIPTVGDHTYAKDSKPVTVAPTCTEIGYTYQVCEECAKADLDPADKDGKKVKDLPSTFTTKGAIVSETKPALGHNFVVLNSDRDVRDWEFKKDAKDGHYIASCVINYECARCRDPKVAQTGVTYTTEKEPATPEEKTVYEGLSTKVTKAKNCTENDVVTVTADGVKDYNAGKDVSKDFADEKVIGPHSYVVKTANFSADGKSVNVTVECANAKCKGEKTRTIAATSTASEVDAATGLTTYTASLTEKDLKTAKIDAAEIDTKIPAEVATKKLYDLTKAEVTVPNYTDDKGYAARKKNDVVVKIGDATINPDFYDITWPTVSAPKLDAELTVTATKFENKGITAYGTSKPVKFEVTKTVLNPVDPVEVKVNGKDPKEKDEFESTYNGKFQTLVATTKTKDAVVSYLIDDKAVDKAEMKDVKFDEDGDIDDYTVNYVIRYKDGTIYESKDYTFTIKPAEIKIIKSDYDKLEGQDDPTIEIDSDNVASGDNLGLRFVKHSETAGTYKLDVLWDNKNYKIVYPTHDYYLTLTIKTDASVKADAEKAGLEAAKVTAENGYDESSVKAVADAKAKLDEAIRTGDTAAMKDATKALNDAIAAADAAKDAGSKEEVAKDAEKAVAAAKDITEANGYSAEDVAAVKAAADAAAAKIADPKSTTADITAATKALNDAMEKAQANKAAVDAAKAAAAITTAAGFDQADVDAVKKAVDALAAAKAKAGATAADIQAATKALNAAVATAKSNKAKIAKAKKLTVKGLKVKAGKKKAVVKFKKTKGAKSYQIQYRIKGKKWTKKVSKKNKFTAKKLKGGKKYQFKVRTISKVGKKTVYGKWTKVKTVKIKK